MCPERGVLEQHRTPTNAHQALWAGLGPEVTDYCQPNRRRTSHTLSPQRVRVKAVFENIETFNTTGMGEGRDKVGGGGGTMPVLHGVDDVEEEQRQQRALATLTQPEPTRDEAHLRTRWASYPQPAAALAETRQSPTLLSAQLRTRWVFGRSLRQRRRRGSNLTAGRPAAEAALLGLRLLTWTRRACTSS